MIEIAKLDNGEYCLIFRPSDTESTLDGHTWSLLVRTYCKVENVDDEGVTHDPESDMYSAISVRKEQLEEIAAAIGKLSSNTVFLQKVLAQIHEPDELDGDMATEEFLEWMADNGFDMNAPQLFTFGLDSFQDSEQVRLIRTEIESQGYKTDVEVIDDEVYFDINVETIPTLSSLLKIEDFLKAIASKYDVEYIGFEVDLQDGVEIS